MLKVAIEGKNTTIYDNLLRELQTFFSENGAVEKL
jgi:hypothetical protein